MTEKTNTEVYEIAGGEVTVWLDGGAICIKTRNPYDDPVDMGEDEAQELGELLLRLVKTVRGG